jgi:hypothetical protein
LPFNIQAKEFVPYNKKKQYAQDSFTDIPISSNSGAGIPVMMSEHYLQNYQTQPLTPQELKYMQLLQSQQ